LIFTCTQPSRINGIRSLVGYVGKMDIHPPDVHRAKNES